MATLTNLWAPPCPPHKGWHTRGYLPHFDQPGLVQSINFRLADSVPVDTILAWKRELNLQRHVPETDDRCVELRKRIERFADRGLGACWLRYPAIANVIENALLHFDNQRYIMLSWCVMPNHVHSMIETITGFPLGDVVQSWKSFTAHACNRLLDRDGEFWMADYFDRFIRDEDHFSFAKEYIETNPVKAGLCERPEDWRWSSAWRGRRG